MGSIGLYILLILILVLVIVIISNIKIVPQAYVYVVERFGTFHAAWGAGLHVKTPFLKNLFMILLKILFECAICWDLATHDWNIDEKAQ